MKLLLTSGGLRNPSLRGAFLALAGAPAGEIKVAFIPTAVDGGMEDNEWAAAHAERLQKLGIGRLDIVDISVLSKEVWLPKLEAANVIFVSGGDTIRLMQWITKSGLQAELPRLLETRLYVGVSAGSYVMAPEIRPSGSKEVSPALGYVDCMLIAHYKNPAFPRAKTLAAVKERARDYPSPVYVLDDESALQVINAAVDVVSEGEYLVL